MADDQLYKVAYDEAVRALADQQGAIESLRNRAGLLLSAAAVTTSFLGTQGLHDGGLSLFSWLALTGFIGAAAASLAILWPRRWEFTADPREVIEAHIECEKHPSTEELHRNLSLHMHHSYLVNRAGFEQLTSFFQLASGLLAVEVVLWVIAITSAP